MQHCRLVKCHLTLWNLHAAQPHLYKIANDCMYASWNHYCHCSATQSPVICDTVALFIATWSPRLLKVKVNPSLYCDNRWLVFHINTGSKSCDIGRPVYSKYSMETHHNKMPYYYTLKTRVNPSLHCDNLCLVFTWSSCSDIIKISLRHQLSINRLKRILKCITNISTIEGIQTLETPRELAAQWPISLPNTEWVI